MDFEALAVMVPMVRPCMMMLLMVAGVGLGWLCPNSLRVLCRGAAILQPLYSAESSALDADDITCLKIDDSVRTAPLLKFVLF